MDELAPISTKESHENQPLHSIFNSSEVVKTSKQDIKLNDVFLVKIHIQGTVCFSKDLQNVSGKFLPYWRVCAALWVSPGLWVWICSCLEKKHLKSVVLLNGISRQKSWETSGQMGGKQKLEGRRENVTAFLQSHHNSYCDRYNCLQLLSRFIRKPLIRTDLNYQRSKWWIFVGLMTQFMD